MDKCCENHYDLLRDIIHDLDWFGIRQDKIDRKDGKIYITCSNCKKEILIPL